MDNTKGRQQQQQRLRQQRPNIIIILADDLGFSDIGCFGSEIYTPNIDSLATTTGGGIRFTQMYNCARCCPSRASLMTGLYPHQAGIGHMVSDASNAVDGGGGKEYQGYLRQDVATIAEILKKRYNYDDDDPPKSTSGGKEGGGYNTYMVGKWHVGGEYPPNATHDWVQKTMGDRTHPTPTQRGFDMFYGTLGGGGSYYQPPSLVRNDTVVKDVMSDDYYYTDAINDEACTIIKEHMSSNDIAGVAAAAAVEHKPFFLYVAHCAPHWPLHAPKDVLQKVKGSYIIGWDLMRNQRHARLVEQGIIPSTWHNSPRDDYSLPWDDSNNMSNISKEWEDARMSCYAAQIMIMDDGIGRILDTLRKTGTYDNTVIFFLSDNGGCAEYLKENGNEGHFTENYNGLTRDGKKRIKVGNDTALMPGPEDTFMSYGLSWANVSNTPFRLYKSFVHEGGIATPCIVHWPAAMFPPSDEEYEHVERQTGNSTKDSGRICHSPWILMDIVATCCDIAGVPSDYLHKIEGESFLPILLSGNDATTTRIKPIFWEHQGNCAMREGKWKLVRKRSNDADVDVEEVNVKKLRSRDDSNGSSINVNVTCGGWELYNMDDDRTELHNLASQYRERVQRMANSWSEWASRVGVKSWPLTPLAKDERDWSNVPWLW